MSNPLIRFYGGIAIVAAILIAIAYFGGQAVANRSIDELEQIHAEQYAELQDDMQMVVDELESTQTEVEGLTLLLSEEQSRTAEMSATIAAQAVEIHELTTDRDEWKTKAQTPLPSPSVSRATPSEGRTAPTVSPPPNPTAAVTSWSAASVRAKLDEASRYFGTDLWAAEKGVGIASRESGYNPTNKNGIYVGLFQFDTGWGVQSCDSLTVKPSGCSHQADWRNCGAHSCYRFIQAYKDGGKGKIQFHWKATIR